MYNLFKSFKKLVKLFIKKNSVANKLYLIFPSKLVKIIFILHILHTGTHFK